MNLVIAITNGFRAWGASSLLLALPVLAPAIVSAVQGALLAAHAEAMLAARHSRRRVALVFLLALWREGDAQPTPVNLWAIAPMMVFLGVAGGSIFIADVFAGGYYDPRLTIVMFFAWLIIATGGWLFTISTARDRISMAVSSVLLLIVFLVLSLGEKVAS